MFGKMKPMKKKEKDLPFIPDEEEMMEKESMDMGKDEEEMDFMEEPMDQKEDMDMDKEMGLESAAEEMMSAIESKDVKGFMEALKSFLDQNY